MHSLAMVESCTAATIIRGMCLAELGDRPFYPRMGAAGSLARQRRPQFEHFVLAIISLGAEVRVLDSLIIRDPADHTSATIMHCLRVSDDR